MWGISSLLKSIQYEVKRMFEIFISSYPTLLKATIVTLQLTLTSLVLGSLIDYYSLSFESLTIKF